MNLLHIEEMTRVMRVTEIIEKATDAFLKFEALIFRRNSVAKVQFSPVLLPFFENRELN